VCGHVSRIWPDFQFMDGEMHDLDESHSGNQCKGALNKWALRVALMPGKWQSFTHT